MNLIENCTFDSEQALVCVFFNFPKAWDSYKHSGIGIRAEIMVHYEVFTRLGRLIPRIKKD